MKIIKLLLIILLIFTTTTAYSQITTKKVEGDTVVVISPKSLNTINRMVVDFERVNNLCSVKDSIINLDSLRIRLLHSTIESMETRDRFKDNLNKTRLRKSKRKMFLWGGGIGIVTGIILKSVL